MKQINSNDSDEYDIDLTFEEKQEKRKKEELIF